MTVPRDLTQLRHIELLERALALTETRGSARGPSMGSMSRDQLIAYIMRQREKQAIRRVAVELAERDKGLSRRFKQQTTEFMDQNDELLRRLADG